MPLKKKTTKKIKSERKDEKKKNEKKWDVMFVKPERILSKSLRNCSETVSKI